MKIEFHPVTRSGNTSGGVFSVSKRTRNDGVFVFFIPKDWGWDQFKVHVATLAGSVSDSSDAPFTSKFRIVR